MNKSSNNNKKATEGVRINKFFTDCGVLSRRAAEAEIEAGRVKINGEIAYRADTQITVYNEWHTALIENIEYNEGDTIVVGIYVKCSGPNAWGKIDDALFNSIKE